MGYIASMIEVRKTEILGRRQFQKCNHEVDDNIKTHFKERVSEFADWIQLTS
jgi:hypothetical protein